MLRMFRQLEDKRQNDESGFTLIELLVVIIIIGILAAIAIPVFLNQRERAWRSAVESDTRNAAVAMEAWYSDEGDYEAAAPFAEGGDLRDRGLTVSENVTLQFFTSGDDDNHQAYCIQGFHENIDGGTGADNPIRVYASTRGGFVNDDDVDDCTDLDEIPDDPNPTTYAWDDAEGP